MTRESTESLGLRTTAFALIKASSIIVATETDGARLSARNQLHGTVAAMTPVAVNAEVVIDMDGGGSIVAIVTQSSLHSLGTHRTTNDRTPGVSPCFNPGCFEDH